MLLRAEARICTEGKGEVGGKNVKYACDKMCQYTRSVRLPNAKLTLLKALRSER